MGEIWALKGTKVLEVDNELSLKGLGLGRGLLGNQGLQALHKMN